VLILNLKNKDPIYNLS